MEATEEDLISFILKRTSEEWENKNVPYYLSNVSPDLRSERVDYRPIVEPLTLKQFVESRMHSVVDVYVHPKHKPKIALVPKGSAFAFEDVKKDPIIDHPSSDQKGRITKDASFASRRTVMQFIDLVSRLDRQDLDRISVPLDVLAKLAKMQ